MAHSYKMYSPHSERKIAAALVQNLCGKAHGVCSELQRSMCVEIGKCQAPWGGAADLELCDEIDIRVKKKVRTTQE